MTPHQIFRMILMTLCAMVAVTSTASAQIGPDLRPPGLESDHPIDSYSRKGGKKVDDWRHEASWELNASDVVFSAAKKRQLISEAPSTIHVITDRDIAAHGWRTLAEVLRHVPGVQTVTTKSQFQSIMIRGLVGTEDNNSRILWLQNGVPMNDVRDSGIWLDDTYPVELIKRIEVVLGPGSALYGSGAFQGVVNIFTKDPADIDKYGEYRIAIQNNLTFKASAIASYTSESGDFGILGHISGNTTQGPGLVGDYVYTNYAMDQAGMSVSAGKDATQFRYQNIDSNSQKHWYSINLKLNYKQLKWNLGFTDIYAGGDGSEIVANIAYDQPKSDSEKLGLVDDTASTSANSTFNRREFYTDFVYEDNFGESVSLLALLSYRFNQYEQENYGYFATRGNSTDIPVLSSNASEISKIETSFKKDIETLQHKLYALAQVQWRIYEANELIGGIVLEYQHINADDLTNGNSDRIENDNISSSSLDATSLGYLTPSLFLQDEQRLWNDRIILTLGARFDAYRLATKNADPDYAPSWRFAFLGKWTDWMTMRLSYGYSFKEPSLYQLFANTVDYVGNENLEPETLHNIELSFLFTPFYFMKIRFDAFASFINNLIVISYDTNQKNESNGISGKYTPTQESGKGANIYGFELSFDTAIGKNWSLYTHYNFLYSDRTYNVDDDNLKIDNRVADDAMHRFKIGATYMTDILTADLAFFLVGGTPTSVSSTAWSRQTYQTPFYAIMQPQISVALPANIGLMLQGSYAFSEGMTKSPTYRYYYEKEGVPVSRYSVMLSLMYPFKK